MLVGTTVLCSSLGFEKENKMNSGSFSQMTLQAHHMICTVLYKYPNVYHVTVLLAGQETTSNQLSFTLYEILTHPHIEERFVAQKLIFLLRILKMAFMLHGKQ